jgi:hypothetical protein
VPCRQCSHFLFFFFYFSCQHSAEAILPGFRLVSWARPVLNPIRSLDSAQSVRSREAQATERSVGGLRGGGRFGAGEGKSLHLSFPASLNHTPTTSSSNPRTATRREHDLTHHHRNNDDLITRSCGKATTRTRPSSKTGRLPSIGTAPASSATAAAPPPRAAAVPATTTLQTTAGAAPPRSRSCLAG